MLRCWSIFRVRIFVKNTFPKCSEHLTSVEIQTVHMLILSLALRCDECELCLADHVQEVGAGRIVALTEVAVIVHAVVGHAVEPVVMRRGVPVVHSQSPQSVHHIHQNIDHVHRRKKSTVKKTIEAGMRARTTIPRLLTIKLLFGDGMTSVTMQVACITLIQLLAHCCDSYPCLFCIYCLLHCMTTVKSDST